jgi:hypothetical protein
VVSFGPILCNGDGASPRNWASQDVGTIDETIAGADDGNHITATAVTTNNDTSFLLGLFPTGLGQVNSLSINVRYQAINRTDDTLALRARVLTTSGTVLAAADSGGVFTTVAVVTSSSFTNSGAISFAYVNTSADALEWHDAKLELRQIYAASGGQDAGCAIRVSALEFNGDYTPTTAVSAGTSTASLKSRAAATSAGTATATEKALAAAAAAGSSTATEGSRATASSAGVATATEQARAAATAAGTATAATGASAAALSAAAATAGISRYTATAAGQTTAALGAQATATGAGAATATLRAQAAATSTDAIGDTELGARTSGTAGSAATALARAQAGGAAAATSAAEVGRESYLESAATATAALSSQAAARAQAEATSSLNGGSLATAEGAATALVSAAASGFAAATTTASRLVPAAAGSSSAQAQAGLLSGFVSCHAVATATLGSQATARAVSAGSANARARAAAGAQGAAVCSANPRPGLSVVASATAKISPNARATSSGSAGATATGSAGEAGFVVWGATNSTPPAPLGTLEYKLDKANYGYALASLKWNNFQYLANGAGKMLLRTVLPGDVVAITSDIVAEADFHTVGTYEVHSETKATDLVSRWRRNIVGRLGLPDVHANVLHVHWVATQEKNTATDPVAGLPNMPPGESEAPHARFEVPELLLVAPLGSVMYLYDAENDIATPRTALIEDLPLVGGPICSTLDATKAIGLFQRGAGQVKWDPSSNIALSLLYTQVEGISSQKGPKFGDFWLVLGTLGEVEEAFIALKDTLASAKRQVVEVSGVSPVAAAPISL